jgi:hypothetical protein
MHWATQLLHYILFLSGCYTSDMGLVFDWLFVSLVGWLAGCK